MSVARVPLLLPALPDAAIANAAAGASDGQGTRFAATFQAALSSAGVALERADAAEHAFAGGHGSLQSMVLERAQADVALSIASAAASRTAQAVSTILGMQI